ncbi:DUF1127 domain-containing protein [Hoeflea sp. YIM 152468]|uniref:DUF1127 domain-containing protein n=1 Tax=Hoeflea sp. YIM 152468 TaxID=3031759 RepID=UPI0023DA46F1|nr:DUF1127 domain-containing protein [Hoeflea sp. YIM 152468]MDF1609328.1 DUF1127 domain-containing protein [Hoeflea sp. YIM 152468]
MSIYLTRQMLDPNFKPQEPRARLAIFRRLFRLVLRRWRRRKMIAALDALDDRLLRDIGIYRGDIKHLVKQFDDRELRMAPVSPAQPAPVLDDEGFRQAA